MVSQVSLKAIKNPSWFFYFCLGLMALIYGAAGLMKVTATPELVAHLNELHFNSAWRLFIGITELLGVVGLLLPRTRALALLCLWPCVIGGLALHIQFRSEVFHGFRAAFLPSVS